MTETEAETFKERLLKLLKQKKLSQLKAAEILGVSRTAVNKWTKGGMIDEDNLDKLATLLDVDKIWLKYGEYTNNQVTVSHSGIMRNINEVHLQESAEIVTWEWDLLTGSLNYSDNVEAVYGIKITTNEDFWALMNQESKEKLVNGYSKIIREGGAHEMDFKINWEGEYRWITSRATGVKGPNGKVTKLVGISLDNTERKNNELNLRKIKCYFDVLLAHFNHLVAFTDKAGEILASNLKNQSSDIDYLELQRLLYQLAINHKPWLEEVAQTGRGQILFQGRQITAYHYFNDEKQPFLMFELKN
ncbi:helix-turn-helix domain-containing protein [Providencia heimbachae]|uniref:histidine kinase n=1 Tax=Providencia heimbachae ATCC 35613 TaxID=1354272 RepID=A0A1B7JQI2_9GAMM|nr:helix-turn-helix transcriptional regulator [Providencia heimbachae]OAT50169.1 two-component hybrid sensor and regulator [Providencia heimbachae ATCC 35613]QCJ68920.1 transcriptional regulator [Providencia heimbachae]SQH11951.1 putative diguanylate cyclase [Providencia heimbachae]